MQLFSNLCSRRKNNLDILVYVIEHSNMKIAIHIYIKITNISRTEIKSKCYYCFLGTLFKPFVEFAKGSQLRSTDRKYNPVFESDDTIYTCSYL